MGDAVAKFVEPILAVIPTPKTGDIEGFVAAYAKILGEFDDEVLEKAAQTIIRTLDKRTMPMPAECIDACREAAAAIERRKQAGNRRPRREQFVWTPEMAKNADRLFASGWGRKAVADKVEIAIWDFMVKHQRWPSGSEYDAVKSQSLARQAETRDFIRIQKENGGVNSMTREWLNTLSRQSDRLKSLALVGQQ